MKRFLTPAAILLTAACAPNVSANDLESSVADDYDYVLDLYKHFHENPELSFKEKNTAARLAEELEGLGFDVTERFGDDWVKKKVMEDEGEIREDVGGYGVVAVMKNGDGPTVMLRADMDALPLEEKTGLPYESQAMGQTHTGKDAPVMHACAHDSHVAILICLLYTSPSPRDRQKSRMPSSA